MDTTEKRFESDIESALLSPAGGYAKGTDVYDPSLALYARTLVDFIRHTQPKEWARFETMNKTDPERKFCLAFNNACDMDGLLSVLRHGFRHRGITFRVCYFKPAIGPPPRSMLPTGSTCTGSGITARTRRKAWTWYSCLTESRSSPSS